MKFFLKLIFVLFIFVLIFKVSNFFIERKRQHDERSAVFLSFEMDSPEEKVKGGLRSFFQGLAHKTKNFIYSEAEKHNPTGDLMPDKVDDVILGKVKEVLN